MDKHRLSPKEVECLVHGPPREDRDAAAGASIDVPDSTTVAETELLTGSQRIDSRAAQSTAFPPGLSTQGDALLALADAVIDRQRSAKHPQRPPAKLDADQACSSQTRATTPPPSNVQVVRPLPQDTTTPPAHVLPVGTSQNRLATNAHQMREFQSIHEVFSDKLARAFSQKLRCDVRVRLTRAQQPSYGEFVFGLDNPTCFHVLDIEPLPGKQSLELHPTILFPLIDRLLGGGKHLGPIVRRPLTAIERRLVARLTDTIFEQLAAAWRSVAIIESSVDCLHANPKLARSSTPLTSVCAFEFEIDLGFARGPMRLAYDGQVLPAIASHLAGDETVPLGYDRLPLEHQAEQMLVDVAIVVGTISDNDFDLTKLAVDDVVLSDADDADLAEVHIDGTKGFLAHFGVTDGHKGIRLEKVLEQASRRRDAA